MIDLHCHILPGLDDGAPDLEASLALAVRAVEEGIDTIAATPHVNDRYAVGPESMAQGVGTLNVALARRELPLAVLPGAEVAIEKIGALDDSTLRRLTLGGTNCLLVETPYSHSVPFLEEILFELQVAGFRPMLAHPERSLAFRERPERLHTVVHHGTLCCINGGSIEGSFGSTVQALALQFIRDGLVHVVASDSHDTGKRAPRLRACFEAAESVLPGIAEQAPYYTEQAPAAILAGGPLPARPDPPAAPQRKGWRARLMRSG